MIIAILIGLAIPVSFGCWLFHYISSLTLYDPQNVVIVSPQRWLAATFVPVLMFLWGLRTGSISKSGAVAGFVVGFVLTLGNACFCVSLIAFFITGSKITKFRSYRKRRLEQDFKEGGQRDWVQVLCNGGPATQLAVFYISEVGCMETPLNFSTHYTASGLCLAVLGALACCAGDTWASEVGAVVGHGDPILVTTLKRVPRGANGGVSLAGTLASAVGGAVVGVAYYIALYFSLSDHVWGENPRQWLVIVYAGVAGLLGSLIDSFLGATLQYSGYDKKLNRVVETPGRDVIHICGRAILDNHGVNIVASVLTSLALPFIAFHTWSYVT